jgi:hypothetical protein
MARNPKTELYSIVIVGQMNPPIHHPAWYRLVGLIDDAELKESIPEPTQEKPVAPMSIVPSVRLKAFEVTCFQNRWDIKTTSRDNLERIRSITEKLFDVILPHTPVGAFGINFEYGIDTGGRSPGGIIASFLSRPPLDLGLAHPDSGELRITENRPSHTFNVFVKPSEKNEDLIIGTNAHYPIPSDTTHSSFSVKEKFDIEFSPRRTESEQLCALISERILGV